MKTCFGCTWCNWKRLKRSDEGANPRTPTIPRWPPIHVEEVASSVPNNYFFKLPFDVQTQWKMHTHEGTIDQKPPWTEPVLLVSRDSFTGTPTATSKEFGVWFWRERRCEPSIVYIYKILRDVEGKKTADFLTSFLWIATTTHDFLCYNTMLHSLQLNVPWRATLKWQHRIYRPKISPDFLFIAIFHVFCCYFTPPKPLFYFALTPLFFLWKSPLNCKLCFILWQ